MTRQPSRHPSFAELHDPEMQRIAREREAEEFEERHIRESVDDECAERKREMEDEE